MYKHNLKQTEKLGTFIVKCLKCDKTFCLCVNCINSSYVELGRYISLDIINLNDNSTSTADNKIIFDFMYNLFNDKIIDCKSF